MPAARVWATGALVGLALYAVPSAPRLAAAPESAATGAAGAPPLAGFTPTSAAREWRAEARLSSLLDPRRVERDFRELTREPHTAGLARNHELAGYVAEAFRAAGLEDVSESAYDVLMSYPEKVSIELLAPEPQALRVVEDVYAVDPDSANPRLGLPYHAYSASGTVEAEVVYARSGSPEDFAYLQSQGIDLHGKLALVRYSVPYSYRGFKAYTAERLGLAGLLIYSDPQDDGFVKGAVYPDGPWGPLGHLQRGAILYDFLVPGDPLTPGWPSLPGARRIAPEAARSLPKILSAPLTARDAARILAALGGPEAPPEWCGALEVAYRIGPGPARVRLALEVPRPVVRIVNVTGRIRGREEPERVVLLGNHRDAWVFGAVDPSSGTATLLELARALGQLVREGWRPRRTLVLASWDAEEFALTGSTEWGEEHLSALREGLVVYLNVDSSTSGSGFSATASGCLIPFIEEAIADVTDPNTGRSLLDVWKEGRRSEERRVGKECRSRWSPYH